MHGQNHIKPVKCLVVSISFYLLWFFQLRDVFFLLNMSFEKARDTSIQCRSNLLKTSQKHLYLIAAKSAVYLDRPRKLNEFKTAVIVYIRNISQAALHKVLENKIKRVQACMDARGPHSQHLL